MSYRLALDVPVSDAVRAVAHERVEHAVAALREGDDRGTAVHDMRKDAKKLRALLRLVSPSLKPRVRRAENAAIRETARRLSGARDAAVLVEVADDLRERSVGQVPETTFAAIDAELTAAAGAGGAVDDETFAAATADLEALAARIEHWPLRRLDVDTLIAGLERSYRQGRAELRATRRGADAEQLHEWRKRVKDLWYEQRLLRDAWPGVLKAQASELDELGELLGDDHDLAVLRDQLTGADGIGARLAVDLDPVVAAIDLRRAELEGRALAIGARVYAEKPAAFARRHRAYLKAARAAG